jgi:phosphotransferase system  glucose/maltose/N-acetylglucosamine-specific IIC component
VAENSPSLLAVTDGGIVSTGSPSKFMIVVALGSNRLPIIYYVIPISISVAAAVAFITYLFYRKRGNPRNSGNLNISQNIQNKKSESKMGKIITDDIEEDPISRNLYLTHTHRCC